MRVGFLGGSFDPVHRGHIKLALAAKRQCRLDKVYLVLSPRSPFKLGKTPTPVEHRLAMLSSAVKGKPGLAVGRFELGVRGPAYTVNTLERYHRAHKRHALFLIMGSDSWKGFRQWKNPRRMAELAFIAVGQRPGDAEIKRPLPSEAQMTVLKGRFPDISSTAVRKKTPARRRSLAPSVRAYIDRHQLYSL